jgi:hypothetical protein
VAGHPPPFLKSAIIIIIMVQLTYVQYVAMTLAGILSATLSLMGSSLILYLARKKWNEPHHRIVSWLSVTDILFSIFGVYGQVLFTPQYSSSTMSHHNLPLYWAHGTAQTCTMVGAISAWLRLAGALLNCSLSINFLLMVRLGWRNETIQTHLERPAYTITALLPSLFLVAGLSLNAYTVVPILNACMLTGSNMQQACWTQTPGPDCEDFNHSHNSTTDSFVASQEQQHNIPLASLSSLVVVLATVVGFTCTFLVYWGVRNQMARVSRYSSMTGVSEELATEVAWQSIWYFLAYFNSFIWPVVMVPIFLKDRIDQSIVLERTGDADLYTLSFVLWLFVPLQGALNVINYIRPYYREWLKVEKIITTFPNNNSNTSKDTAITTTNDNNINSNNKNNRNSNDTMAQTMSTWEILHLILDGTELPSRSTRLPSSNLNGRSFRWIPAGGAEGSTLRNASSRNILKSRSLFLGESLTRSGFLLGGVEAVENENSNEDKENASSSSSSSSVRFTRLPVTTTTSTTSNENTNQQDRVDEEGEVEEQLAETGHIVVEKGASLSSSTATTR